MKRKGAATVEFAVVLPLFVLLMLGMIEMGRAVIIQQTITNCSREAARRAVVDGATEQDVRDVVNEYLTKAGVYGWNGVDAQGNPVGKPCTDAVLEFGETLADIDFGDPVIVTVKLRWDKVAWLPGESQYLGEYLEATTTFRREADL